MFRIGQGYDTHRFVEGRDLILGGIKIPHTHGLHGHSDADVLTHAIIDAILGAANLGDIGQLFPNNNAQYKDINSQILLKETINRLTESGYKIINIDSTIVCQKPKILPHKKSITQSLCKTMNINSEQINLKAKTAEEMGALGREEGMAAMAICLVEQI